MLTIVKQTDILKHWDKIEKCIEFFAKTSLKKYSDKDKLRDSIRDNLLSDFYKLWILTGEEEKIKAIVITSFGKVSLIMKSLHISALMGFEPLVDEEYISSFKVLTAFAKENACELITGESSNDYLVSKFKKLGGTGYSLNLYWEV